MTLSRPFLVAGKPAGILLFSAAAVASGLCVLPEGVDWRAMTGAGMLAGIGFTMSLFVAHLAFAPGNTDQAVIAVLASSALAGTAGLLYLRYYGSRGYGHSEGE
ncbi:MAG TPA: Na+/H+ antiporter NhaA [Bacteroidota bacterium]|nr:Na+/H+ antiporter NhaA [Bacteroidota bacterium]